MRVISEKFKLRSAELEGFRRWLLVFIMIETTAAATFVAGGVSTTATIYVNRHFEVRDHDQPTKYVFNGDTRVAAVTGSLSSAARIQRLRFYAGWNLVSLAVSGADVAGQIEHQNPGDMESVYRWNPATGNYSNVVAGEVLDAGAVLWMKVRTTGAAGISGSYAMPSSELVRAGGGYVAGTGLEDWAPAIPSDASGWFYEAERQGWSENLGGGLESLPASRTTVAPGQALYVRTVSETDLRIPDPNLRVRYYHEDHLGSAAAITDASGDLLEQTAFYPFGSARNRVVPRQIQAPYQFTQKEQDAESGMDYFEARYLEAGLGRFLSADRKYANADSLLSRDSSAFLAGPQEINLYAYVQNNPIRLTDPTGLGPQDSLIPIYAKEHARDANYEIDWGWFGRQYNKAEGKYKDFRNEYCFWPVEHCDIDWRRTFRLNGDDSKNSKPKTTDKPSGSNSGGPVIDLKEHEEPEVHYQVTAHDDAPPPPSGSAKPVSIRHAKPTRIRQAHMLTTDECGTGIHNLKP